MTVGEVCKGIDMQGFTPAVVIGVIAATAFEHGLALVTRNAKDFASPGVALLNPGIV
jgi:predicted nucleic acid-binding protein